MSQIKSLTREQESNIPKCIEKWVGMASKPMNHKKAIKYTRKLYKSIGLEPPLIIFGFSPINTILLCELFFKLIKEDKDLLKKFDSQLYSQLSSQLSSQLYSQLYSELRSQLYSQLYSQLRSQLDSQLSSQLSSQLDSQLDSQLYSQLDSQLDSQLYSQLDSQTDNDILKSIRSNFYVNIYWLVWCGWYEYGKSIGVEFDNEKYDLFMNFNSEVNFIIPYKGICFISEKPTEINWSNNRLHKDGGLAVKYSDGYGMYILNGVNVPEYLAMTPESNLDLEFFKKEKNVEVRAQFIRKYGIERLKTQGKSKEKNDVYELIDMSPIFSRVQYAPYLFMVNPSTGTIHSEGVAPECQTIQQALNWRNQTEETPVTLT